MPFRRLFFLTLVVVAALAAGAVAWAIRRPEIAAVARPDPASFDAALVERGEMLAGFGNCRVCHTRPGGRPNAGGLALSTPFGVVYTTNITPDPESGIGAWSEEAFVRAMREGIDREGHYLYPAFPYDFFANVGDEDLHAIYAYLMSQEAVAERAPENELRFPFNFRILMAGWNLLFFEGGAFEPDSSKGEEWNRGAYLVEGLGHCGACHSPRNRFGAVVRSAQAAYSGGTAEGWHVPPLDETTRTPIPWTEDTLVNYLIDGWDEDHGIAAGPMKPVVDDVYAQSEDDVYAIAAYVMSLKGGELPEAEQKAREDELRAFAEQVEWGHPENPPIPEDPVMQQGARVYEAQCASCHKLGGIPALLALTDAVNAPDPRNLISMVFSGIQPPQGASNRSMPGRAVQISDEEMVALAAFVRARFSRQPAWQDLGAAVAEVREELSRESGPRQ